MTILIQLYHTIIDILISLFLDPDKSQHNCSDTYYYRNNNFINYNNILYITEPKDWGTTVQDVVGPLNKILNWDWPRPYLKRDPDPLDPLPPKKILDTALKPLHLCVENAPCTIVWATLLGNWKQQNKNNIMWHCDGRWYTVLLSIIVIIIKINSCVDGETKKQNRLVSGVIVTRPHDDIIF